MKFQEWYTLIKWISQELTLCFVLDQLKNRLKANAVPIQLPIGAEDQFKGIVDLIKMQAFIHKDDLGKDIEITEIPEELKAQAEEFRAKIDRSCC